VSKLFPDYPEDFSKLVVGTGLQVNFLGNGIEQFDVRYLESVDVGVNGHFRHSGMDVHCRCHFRCLLLKIEKDAVPSKEAASLGLLVLSGSYG
jgi:hypothetical protein